MGSPARRPARARDRGLRQDPLLRPLRHRPRPRQRRRAGRHLRSAARGPESRRRHRGGPRASRGPPDARQRCDSQGATVRRPGMRDAPERRRLGVLPAGTGSLIAAAGGEYAVADGRPAARHPVPVRSRQRKGGGRRGSGVHTRHRAHRGIRGERTRDASSPSGMGPASTRRRDCRAGRWARASRRR